MRFRVAVRALMIEGNADVGGLSAAGLEPNVMLNIPSAASICDASAPGRRTRFLAALGMTSLEAVDAVEHQAPAIRYKPAASS